MRMHVGILKSFFMVQIQDLGADLVFFVIMVGHLWPFLINPLKIVDDGGFMILMAHWKAYVV